MADSDPPPAAATPGVTDRSRRRRHERHPIFAAALAVLILAVAVAADAYAGSATVTLRRVTLTNVDDAAGRWQYEGGTVLRGATAVGNYALTRRVVNGGTSPQNTAMVTLTLFFNPERPPQNITLQGAHDFASGVYRGSVSAAS